MLFPRAGGNPVRLHYNENAAGTSPLAIEAVKRGLTESNLYADVRGDEYIEALSNYYKLSVDNLISGNGSTEILTMSLMYANKPGLKVLAPSMSFEVIETLCGTYRIPYEGVPMNEDLTVNIKALKAAAEAYDGPVMVYLTSPNNPTGDLTHSDNFHDWVRHAPDNIFFLIDEAYIDFVRDENHKSAIELVRKGQRNLVVTRTFSKVYGMAGLRVGYGVAMPEVALAINDRSGGTNMNVAALAAGVAGLKDREFYGASLKSNIKSRKIATDILDELGLDYVKGDTNFIFHEIGVDHREYQPRMLKHGFKVGRLMGGLERHNRVSLGVPEEMERFAETLRMFRHNGWV
jgi:histidinol-phosphate aminotransferase